MADLKKLLEGYNDQFTLDGKLKPAQFGVTKEKALFIKSLYEKARGGSRVAEAQLAELFASTDASFSMAHLLNIETIPQLPEELEDFDNLVGKRTVKNFNPVVLRSLIGSAGVEGSGVNADGSAAIVPEGTPYPIVTVKSDEESFYSKLNKRGVQFDWTFEAWINDVVGELEEMPRQILTLTKDTIHAEIFDALDQANDQLGAVTLPDGTVIPANAALSPLAVIAAAVELENRTINDRKIGQISAFNLLVAPGQKRFFEYQLAQFGRVLTVQDGDGGDGTLILGPDTTIQAMFPNVTVVEAERITGTQWKLVPKPGTTKGRPVWERLSLRGYENPELRVRNDQGFLPGGGKVGLFEGGFVADTSSLRYRFITGAVLWDPTWIVASDGDNVA